MTSQPDKLFRDKLENFQRPAPAGAWDKINSNLSHSSKKVVWMRVAAGLALLATAALIFWPREQAENNFAETKPTPVLKDDAPQKLKKHDPVITPKEEILNNTKNHVAKKENINKQNHQTPDTRFPEVNTVIHDSAAVILPESQPLMAEVSPEPTEKPASNKMVYTVAEVNSKFLKKKSTLQATPDQNDASGIQKLIGLAYTAKNSDPGLGDLRQKKDDILALNFGKKKGEN